MYEAIKQSRRAADRLKSQTPVMVVLGNPPYLERASKLSPAPWIEQHCPDRALRPSLDAFRAPGKGRYEQRMYNLHIYFWRWATWKVFDAHPSQPSGVVAFVTTSAYITGPAFAGMREYLRRTTDEGWIIDLSPEGHQPHMGTRVFRANQHSRRGSPLDDIRPDWDSETTGELLDLLNVLGLCVALEPNQTDLLDRILTGPIIGVTELTQAGVLPIPNHARCTPRQHQPPDLWQTQG